jgi:hypothetical protein
VLRLVVRVLLCRETPRCSRVDGSLIAGQLLDERSSAVRAPLLVGGRGAESAKKIRGVRVDRGHMCDPAARGTPRGVSVAGGASAVCREDSEKSGHKTIFKI